MRKKFLKINLVLIFLLMITTTIFNANVYGVVNNMIIDTDYTETVYKFSDNTENIYLPYVRYSSDRVEVDKEINKSGIIFAQKSIDISEKTSGIQVLFSGEAIRARANSEYQVVFCDSYVLDSKIDKSLIVFAQNVNITENAVVSEDLIVFATNLTVSGTVNGSIVGYCATTNISGNVDKDLRIGAGNLTISGSENIKGNILIETTNPNLNISTNYPNAVVNLTEANLAEESNKIDFGAIILDAIVLALAFIFVEKISEKKLFAGATEKLKHHRVSVGVFGLFSFLLFLPIFLMLIILSLVGFYIITVPIMLIYGAILIISSMLATFVVGGILFKYIKEKYLSNYSKAYDFVAIAVIYFVLNLITSIDTVGNIVQLAMFIITIGIVFTAMFIKEKVVVKTESEVIKEADVNNDNPDNKEDKK